MFKSLRYVHTNAQKFEMLSVTDTSGVSSGSSRAREAVDGAFDRQEDHESHVDPKLPGDLEHYRLHGARELL